MQEILNMIGLFQKVVKEVHELFDYGVVIAGVVHSHSKKLQ